MLLKVHMEVIHTQTKDGQTIVVAVEKAPANPDGGKNPNNAMCMVGFDRPTAPKAETSEKTHTTTNKTHAAANKTHTAANKVPIAPTATAREMTRGKAKEAETAAAAVGLARTAAAEAKAEVEAAAEFEAAVTAAADAFFAAKEEKANIKVATTTATATTTAAATATATATAKSATAEIAAATPAKSATAATKPKGKVQKSKAKAQADAEAAKVAAAAPKAVVATNANSLETTGMVMAGVNVVRIRDLKNASVRKTGQGDIAAGTGIIGTITPFTFNFGGQEAAAADNGSDTGAIGPTPDAKRKKKKKRKKGKAQSESVETIEDGCINTSVVASPTPAAPASVPAPTSASAPAPTSASAPASAPVFAVAAPSVRDSTDNEFSAPGHYPTTPLALPDTQAQPTTHTPLPPTAVLHPLLPSAISAAAALPTGASPPTAPSPAGTTPPTLPAAPPAAPSAVAAFAKLIAPLVSTATVPTPPLTQPHDSHPRMEQQHQSAAAEEWNMSDVLGFLVRCTPHPPPPI
jgi:hypothetical protein